MTTIAYRDGIVAADTKCSDEVLQQKYFRRKIRVFDDAVIAESGEDQWIDVFCDWWEAGRPAPSPKIKNGDIGMIVVHRDLRVEVWLDAQYGIPMIEDYVACGSGAFAALGAMFMGGSAADGVRAAIRHEMGTGGRVTTVDVRKALKAGKR